ncbi:MAG: N-formylglutamate amidohydrolase [Alphaproteobacteria bacterium]|nr:N-formylglutamate amidohydrolase [Alphaproteobacteria bacterium]
MQEIDYSKLVICTEKLIGEAKFPLVVASPHSGSIAPQAFLESAALSLCELRSTEDIFIGEMVSDLALKGIPVLEMNLLRAFIDVNRDKIELDEKMFKDYPADKNLFESGHCRSGYGLIHRVNAQGKPIYKDLLSYGEVQKRIKNVYDVYHKKLNTLIEKCVQKFGICYVLDCHSMPSKICEILWDDAKIDVCIGNLFEQSCPQPDSSFLVKQFEEKGYATRQNIPYSGGYTVFQYCQPRKKIFTIQIELNRALYANEQKLEKNQNFETVKTDLYDSILAFATFVQNRK